jgi:hypothetical protein
MINVHRPLGLAWYTPESWRQLEEAITAAGLAKSMLLGSYAEFVARFDNMRHEFERQGVKVKKAPIDVARMVARCERQGVRIDAAGRAKYMALGGGEP